MKTAGWPLDRVRGSHHVFVHPDRADHVVVLHPKRDLGPELVAAIRKQAKVWVVMRYPSPSNRIPKTLPTVSSYPTCRVFSTGDALDEAMAGAEEAVAA